MSDQIGRGLKKNAHLLQFFGNASRETFWWQSGLQQIRDSIINRKSSGTQFGVSNEDDYGDLVRRETAKSSALKNQLVESP